MFILVHLLSVGIFYICFQWDSNLKNIHLLLHSIDSILDLVSVRSQGGGGNGTSPWKGMGRDVCIYQKSANINQSSDLFNKIVVPPSGSPRNTPFLKGNPSVEKLSVNTRESWFIHGVDIKLNSAGTLNLLRVCMMRGCGYWTKCIF